MSKIPTEIAVKYKLKYGITPYKKSCGGENCGKNMWVVAPIGYCDNCFSIKVGPVENLDKDRREITW